MEKGFKKEENHTISSGNRLEPNIWKESYTIRSYEVDARGNLSVPSIFNFIQNAASNHAHALGVSVQQLLASNHTWVLSRLLVKLDSYPGWQDRIRVHTWPSGVESLFALRDFDLKDQNGLSFGACISAWLIIDSRRRRPVRISPFVGRLNPIDNKHVLTDKLGKLQGFDAKDNQQQFRVGHRDLDLNQHVNSVRYIEWAMESIPPAVRSTSVLARLEINFLAEAFFGDRVIAMCQPAYKEPDKEPDGEGTSYFHSILREESDQELARVKTHWRPVSVREGASVNS